MTWLGGIRYRIVEEHTGPFVLHDENGKACGTVEGIGFVTLVPA